MAIDPPLPPLLQEAVTSIPYGSATSVLLHVREPYWEEDQLPPNIWSDLPIERGFLNPSPTGEGHDLWIFATGKADLARRGWTDAAVGQFVIDELSRVRPATQGRLELAGVKQWTRNPFTLGTYSFLAPGQVERFGNVLSKPAGRLYLAGEHTSELQLGLEGAMESGERAALGIYERL